MNRQFDARLSAASLGAGETEIIALALEIGISSSSVLLDDLKARILALRLGPEVNGTVGVLLAAKRHGLLAAVRPEIEALLDVGLHLAPDLVEVALADIGKGTGPPPGAGCATRPGAVPTKLDRWGSI